MPSTINEVNLQNAQDSVNVQAPPATGGGGTGESSDTNAEAATVAAATSAQLLQQLEVLGQHRQAAAAVASIVGGSGTNSSNLNNNSNSTGLGGGAARYWMDRGGGEGGRRAFPAAAMGANRRVASLSSRHLEDQGVSADDEDDAMFKLTINQRLGIAIPTTTSMGTTVNSASIQQTGGGTEDGAQNRDEGAASGVNIDQHDTSAGVSPRKK